MVQVEPIVFKEGNVVAYWHLFTLKYGVPSGVSFKVEVVSEEGIMLREVESTSLGVIFVPYAQKEEFKGKLMLVR